MRKTMVQTVGLWLLLALLLAACQPIQRLPASQAAIVTASGAEPSATAADLIRTTERTRLRAMVEADMDVAEQLHADDFQLINPGGGTVSKEEFLGDVASGFIDFVVWEPTSEMAVRLYGVNTAVIRYQSLIDIVVAGGEEKVSVWHTDLYEQHDGQWQIVWEQSTSIEQ